MTFRVYLVTIVHFKGLAFQLNWQIIFYVDLFVNNWLALICHGFLHCVAVLPVILIFPTHICWNFFWRHTSDLHLSNCCEASKPTSLLPLLLCVVLLSKYKTFFCLTTLYKKETILLKFPDQKGYWFLVHALNFKFSKYVAFFEKSELPKPNYCYKKIWQSGN